MKLASETYLLRKAEWREPYLLGDGPACRQSRRPDLEQQMEHSIKPLALLPTGRF